MVPGGRGLARDADGVLFCTGALPGERALVHLVARRGGARHATVVDILRPSPERTAPDCPLHARPGQAGCGGCDLLDASAAMQREIKIGIVRDALVRVGRLPGTILDAALRVLDAPGAEDDCGRRRARFVIDPDGQPTFSQRDGPKRVPVRACPALHPLLARALADLPPLSPGGELRLACDDRGHVAAAWTTSPRALADAQRLLSSGAVQGVVVVDGDVDVATFGDPLLHGEVAPGLRAGPLLSDAATFTQANRFGSLAILRRVLEACGEVRGRSVLELFAGAGHLTLPLWEAGALRVDAVEGDGRAVRFLEQNIARAQATVGCSARRAFIDERLALADVDIVVADPPRTGIPGFARLWERMAAPVLVLVSCDPATGARDVAAALRAGFSLDWLRPIDAFARTHHVEWVARLTRPGARPAGPV